MKKIYITGIAGLLGSNIAYELAGKYKIHGVDLIDVNMPGITSEVCDILDYKQLIKSILKFKPDVIIHTAAAVNVDLCEEKLEYAEKLNSDLTREISEISQKFNIKMVYISTDAVFDGTKCQPYTELDFTNPVNIYGKTKLKGEKYVLRNKHNLVLRTNIYGFNFVEKNSFGEWILRSLINNEKLNMFDDIIFSPILVNELAHIIDKAIQKNIEGIYHACGTGTISKYDFGCYLKEKFEIKTGQIIKSKSTEHTFKAKRSINMGMSNEKLKLNLNIKIRTPKESIDFFKKLYDENYPDKLKLFGGGSNGN